MKKYVCLLILMSFFWGSEVKAADYFIPFAGTSEFPNSGSGTCSPTNSFHNPVSFVNQSVTGTSSSSVVYDINRIDVQGNTLNLYGWAFNKVVNNVLGGTDPNSATKVYLVLSDTKPTGSVPDEFEFTISYDTSGAVPHLKYYNLTYWNCYRTSASSSGAGTCIDSATNFLQGGFKASIDLNAAKTKAIELNKLNLKVYMFVDSAQPYTNGRDKEQVWFELAASNDSNTVDSSVNAYNASGNGIAISGLSNKAKIVVSSGRLMGSNGLMCSSPASGTSLNYNQIYYTYGQEYTVLEKTSAYRGPNMEQFKQSLFKLQTEKATRNGQHVKPGTQWTAYAPASWLEFTGQMKISFQKDETEELLCPDGYVGYNGTNVPFTNNYLFVGSVNSAALPASSLLLAKTNGSNSKISDAKILQKLINDYSVSTNKTYTWNDTKILKKEKVEINSANAVDFYSKFMTTLNYTDKYYSEERNFYIHHTKWCDTTSGTERCYDTSSTPAESNPLEFFKRSVYAQTLTINEQYNSANNGFQFDIIRKYYSKSDYKNHMMSTTPITDDVLYNPAQYSVTYCIAVNEVTTPECADDTRAAVCEADDNGTEVVFHENDDLKACTLKNTVASGFTIIESNETKATYNNKSYCEVACKDDINILLPTSKEVESGQYFVLDNYTPEITAKRTCVTTELDYSEFEADLIAAENDMIDAYNIWQDYKHYYEGQASNPQDDGHYSGSRSTGCCDNTCGEEGPSCCDSGDSCSWSNDKWSTNYTGPNGTSFMESGCDGTTSCGLCGNSDTYCSYNSSDLKTNAYNNMNDKYNLYIEAKDKYEDLVYRYKKCTEWIDDDYYDFTFKPKVTFNYDNVDSSLFPTEYEYDYSDLNEVVYKYDRHINDGFNIVTQYWEEDKSTNYDYTENSSSDTNKDIKIRKLVSCTGDTCTATTDNTVSNSFITSAYIKREEDVGYTYHLPKVYTTIPSGRWKTSCVNGPCLELEQDAVPISINTAEGTENYSIKIEDINDSLRNTKSSPYSKRHYSLEERFYDDITGIHESSGYVCHYNITQDVLKDKLNYFYRTIDLADINPNNRTLGYNWSTSKAETVIERLEESSTSYQKLTNDNDRFSFTLTPPIMKAIRDYNDTVPNGYDDWNLTCNDYDGTGNGYHCYSNFLTCFASSGGNGTNCHNIFENTLSNYNRVSNYDDDALNDNREILINKQNDLDGRW